MIFTKIIDVQTFLRDTCNHTCTHPHMYKWNLAVDRSCEWDKQDCTQLLLFFSQITFFCMQQPTAIIHNNPLDSTGSSPLLFIHKIDWSHCFDCFFFLAKICKLADHTKACYFPKKKSQQNPVQTWRQAESHDSVHKLDFS